MATRKVARAEEEALVGIDAEEPEDFAEEEEEEEVAEDVEEAADEKLTEVDAESADVVVDEEEDEEEGEQVSDVTLAFEESEEEPLAEDILPAQGEWEE